MKMLRIALRGLGALAALGLPALTLFACVQQTPPMIEGPSGEPILLETWTATLSAPSGQLRGSAMLAPGVTYRETQATLTLAGATPSAVHGWYVQLGQCGHDRGILVGPQAYTPIAINAQGEGRTTVTLPFTVPTGGHFFVTVRQTDSEAAPVIACGNLTKDRPAVGPTVANAQTR
jgi:hypothetical protein